MIHRKESGQLKAKAGLGIVDNILSTLSNNAISNKAVATEFAKINADLYKGTKTVLLDLTSDFIANHQVDLTGYKAIEIKVVIKYDNVYLEHTKILLSINPSYPSYGGYEVISMVNTGAQSSDLWFQTNLVSHIHFTRYDTSYSGATLFRIVVSGIK